jgi:daunorubicin resistance ABC transporter ATP-binding subunit
MANGEYAIECKGLTRRFGDFTAVDSLDLRIRKGELFGFLGPNGAGKTTTIKMLTTLLKPTLGDAEVASYDIRTDAAFVRSRIGVVPQEFALFKELTAMENLWYIGELYGMGRGDFERRSTELLRTVNLLDKKDVLAGGFSGGMKQRLSVAAGLLHRPNILFMDEPTTGLDPQSRIAIRELTKQLNDEGMTIVYTTHDMEEADKLCERLAIMDHGRIIAEGTPDELKSRYGGGHRIELELAEHDDALVKQIMDLVKGTSYEAEGHRIDISVPSVGGGILHSLSRFLEKKGIEVKELRSKEPSLEDVFLNLTSKEMRD